MYKTVKMFDYWAFHRDGTVQFYQIQEGKVVDYRIYDQIEDAPVVLVPYEEPLKLRYHGRAYLAPRHSQSTSTHSPKADI